MGLTCDGSRDSFLSFEGYDDDCKEELGDLVELLQLDAFPVAYLAKLSVANREAFEELRLKYGVGVLPYNKHPAGGPGVD